MANKNYELFTIDANELMKSSLLELDDNNNNYYFHYIFQIDSISNLDQKEPIDQKTNPMLDQIRLIYDDDYDIFNQKADSDDFMLDKVVKIDFSSFFRNKKYSLLDVIDFIQTENLEIKKSSVHNRYNDDSSDIDTAAKKIYSLFTKGFDMLFPEKVDENGNVTPNIVHMLPFERTSSQSRESKMLFVNTELIPYYTSTKEELEQKTDDEIAELKKIDIVNRLLNDMEISDKETFNNVFKAIPISKYYMYRGLSTSDGKPCKCVENAEDAIVLEDGVEVEKFPVLNEKTVIVINDVETDLKYEIDLIEITDTEEYEDPESKETKTKICPIKETTPLELDEEGLKQYHTKRKFTIDNIYDGQGLCSVDFAEKISKQYDGTNKSACFQFRMPLCKGVLYSIDFKNIIKSYFTHNEEGYSQDEMFNKIYIKDAFGIYRKLADVEVIITASQFKFIKYMKAYFKDYSKNSDLSPDGFIKGENEYDRNNDPIALYMDSFHKYKNAFYVLSSNNDIKTNRSGFTDYSYQFLATSALTNDDLKNLVEKHADAIFDIKPTKECQLQNNEIKYTKDGKFAEGTSEELINFLSKDEFVEKNPTMLSEAKMKNNFQSNRYSYLKDIANGNFKVKGSYQFLSRDFLHMIIDTIKDKHSGRELVFLSKDNSLNPLLSVEDNNANHQELLKHRLPSSRFYSANHAKKDKLFTLYRSPHYSRNEVGLLRSYKFVTEDTEFVKLCKLKDFNGTIDEFDFYKKYCNNQNIVQLPKYSTMAARLGGADFDGDHVKLINDETIVNSICNYFNLKKDPKGDCNPRNLKKDWFESYEELNPFVNITSGGTKEIIESKNDIREYTDAFTRKVLPATLRMFYSQVGLFTNEIFTIAGNTYSKKYDEYIDFLNGAEGLNGQELKDYYNNNQRNEYCSIPALGTILNGNIIDYQKAGFYPRRALDDIDGFKAKMQYDMGMIFNDDTKADDKDNSARALNRTLILTANSANPKDYFLYLCSKSGILKKDFNFNTALRSNALKKVQVKQVEQEEQRKEKASTVVPTAIKKKVSIDIAYEEDDDYDESDINYKDSINELASDESFIIDSNKDSKPKKQIQNKTIRIPDNEKIEIRDYNPENKEDSSFTFGLKDCSSEYVTKADVITYEQLKDSIYIRRFDKSFTPLYNTPSYFTKYLKCLLASKNLKASIACSERTTGAKLKQYTFSQKESQLNETNNGEKLSQVASIIFAYKTVRKTNRTLINATKNTSNKIEKEVINKLISYKANLYKPDNIQQLIDVYNINDDDITNININTIINELASACFDLCEQNARKFKIIERSLLGLSHEGQSIPEKYKLHYDSKYLKDSNGKPKQMSNCWIYAGDSSLEVRKEFLDSLFYNCNFGDDIIKEIAYNFVCDFRNNGSLILPTIFKWASKNFESNPSSHTDIIKDSEKFDNQDAKENSKFFNAREDYRKHIRELNKILNLQANGVISNKAFELRVKGYCKKELDSLFDNIEDEMCYIHKVSKHKIGPLFKAVDTNLEFLFDVISKKDILDAIIDTKNL